MRVYVKIDDVGRITAVNSECFISDLTAWIEIDNGEGDKYYHAQQNYFSKSIFDNDGIYCYKLVDGTPMERSTAEIDNDRSKIIPGVSTDDITIEMLVDHEYRLCLIELGI